MENQSLATALPNGIADEVHQQVSNEMAVIPDKVGRNFEQSFHIAPFGTQTKTIYWLIKVLEHFIPKKMDCPA